MTREVHVSELSKAELERYLESYSRGRNVSPALADSLRSVFAASFDAGPRRRSVDLPTLRELWQLEVAGPLGLWCEYEVYGLAWPRRFRADVLLRADRVVVELDGGVLAPNPSTGERGAHGSVKGIINDIDKGNTYQVAGYAFLRFVRPMLTSGEAREVVAALLRRLRGR